MRPRSPTLAAEVAKCLKADFGTKRQSIYAVAAITGAADATVRNWFAGRTSLNGLYLLKLMAASPSVMAMADRRTGRKEWEAEVKRRARRALPIIKALAK